jgi:hypothetical protein
MITTGIKAANIEIPVIAGDHQHVRLDVLPLSLQQTAQQSFIGGNSRFIDDEPAYEVTR